MIDEQTFRKIMRGETIRLETTSTENEIIDMKKWLQQFGRTVSVNIYPKQGGVRATLWIGALQLNHRSLLSGTLQSTSLFFKTINGDTS